MPFVFLFSTIGSALLFAVTFFLRKQATKYISPSTALFFEVIVELCIVFLWFLFSSPDLKKGFDIHSRGIQFAMLAGVTAAIAIALNYLALRSGFLSKVVAVTSPSQIMFGIFLAALLLREPFTIKHVIGTVLGIISILIIVL